MMKDDKNTVIPGTDPAPIIVAALNATKKLSLFDRILNKSVLFCNAMELTLKVLQRNQELEGKILLLVETIKIHERSLIDLYERNGVVVQHVQASQRVNALDLRLPDINNGGGEKPN
jgi:hypothetical protein